MYAGRRKFMHDIGVNCIWNEWLAIRLDADFYGLNRNAAKYIVQKRFFGLDCMRLNVFL